MKTLIVKFTKVLTLLLMVTMISGNASATTPPAKPSREQIAKDLVGHRLNEGYEDGWFSEDWHWDVKSGQIKALKILEVLRNTEKNYCVVVLIRLRSEVNAFNAKVKINYQLTKENKWKIEYAVSLGMDIVRTHKYDDCLSFKIVDDGWGGVNYLRITNNSGIELGCAGYIQTYDKWKKFAVRIAPYQTGSVGGTFGGGSVYNYKIEFIERP